MITYDEAMKLIEGLGPFDRTMGVTTLSLQDARGHRLAEDLRAEYPSPPFTNSAMDGFAFKHSDATAQSAGLAISGTIFARPVGPNDIPDYQPGSAVRIMTGAVLPEWADTVIPVEQTEVTTAGGREFVRLTKVPALGSHIRRQGEDLPAGEIVMKAGIRLDAERLMVAAAFGSPELAVYRKPRIRIFATGDELRRPGEPLVPGTLYNSSETFLLAAAAEVGLTDVEARWLPDDESRAMAEISAEVEKATAAGQPLLILTTGAVSAGERDFVPGVAANLGFAALMHKVAIRPGKPVFLADHSPSEGRVLWLGLPGNAISTCVGWHAFVRPLLASWAGLPPPQKRKVSLRQPVRKPEGLRCFYRAELNGETAWVPPDQGSARLAATIGAEAYVELPEGREMVPADTVVTAIIL